MLHDTARLLSSSAFLLFLFIVTGFFQGSPIGGLDVLRRLKILTEEDIGPSFDIQLSWSSGKEEHQVDLL